MGSQSTAPRERVLRWNQLFTLLLLVELAHPAWSQQLAPVHIADAVLYGATLPDAPQPQRAIQPPAQPQTQPTAQVPQQSEESVTTGSIHGVITDRDGAVYEGVHVSLTHADPAIPPKNITTDSNGRFSFIDVPAGPFQLTVSSSGFATQNVSGILHPGESYESPSIVLPFANATTEVEVTASRAEIATEELHAEEQQRVFGIIPNFYVVYAPNAPPLSSRQKFHLAWRSEIDPVSIAADLAEAAIEQENDDYKGYGQGTAGYAKRFGAAYGTDFISSMLGGAILPSLLKQDPRYFYKGTGTIHARIFYALKTAVICKSDSGRWQPNYSGILGSLAAGGIANLYYPAADRNGAGLTFSNALIGIGTSAAQNIFQEFVVRKLTPHIPNYNSGKP